MNLHPWINRIICGDCMEIMPQLPSGSIDLVVTSPPYNIRNTTGKNRGPSAWKQAKIHTVGYDGYSDDLPHDEYVAWQRACLTEMMRLLTPTGAIFYQHKWRVQGGLHQDRHDILDGFPVRQVIIWDRMGGFNNNQGYFIPRYDVIYLIAQPDFVLAPYEQNQGNLWRIAPEYGNPHPCPFPRELARRCIKATTARTILDPFIGSGTTALAAMALGRDYIGIEQSALYCRMADERINPPLLKLIQETTTA